MPFTFPAPEPHSARLRLLENLLQPKDRAGLEELCLRSAAVTRKHFGQTMRLFAPLYVSNECVNNCSYCGFSRDNNAILRVTLTMRQVIQEAQHLAAAGFRSVLLVAGEHPRFVSDGYLEECIRTLKKFIPAISIEVGPMEVPEYERMVAAGAEGLIVYHETYDRATYAQMHTAGPKKDFDWRLACPERGYAAGFRRIGLGALLGMVDWRVEVMALAAHLEYLQKHCWKAHYSLALPRLRPAAGGFQPTHPVGDADFLQMIAALRIAFPDVGLSLSTRESPALRDVMIPLGITTMSAGSHTEPGGYTGAGQEDLHLTVKGKRVERSCANGQDKAEGQFDISDERTPQEVASALMARGFDPVWKDWDEAILSPLS